MVGEANEYQSKFKLSKDSKSLAGNLFAKICSG
jgi:hypothetical protein